MALITSRDMTRIMSKIETTDDHEEHECSICKDGGVVFFRDENGVDRCAECECSKRKRYMRKIEKSGLKTAIENQTMESFRQLSPLHTQAVSMCSIFCEDPSDALIITGPSGTGKTHLATAVCAKFLKEHKRGVLYAKYRDIINAIKPLTMDIEARVKAMDEYVNPDWLYIDDLYKGTVTDADLNVVYDLINERYLRDRGVIVTSERSLEELLAVSDAIAGRLIEMADGYVINLSGLKNYRAAGAMSRIRQREEQAVMRRE